MTSDFDCKELDAAIGEAPWYFRLGRYLSRRKIRGGTRLLRVARARGLLDRLALYPIDERVSLRVPLWRPCNAWDQRDVETYEASLRQIFGAAIEQAAGGVTLIDCGADIGTVSAHLVARCRNIESVIAFEPNRAAYRVLTLNLDALRVKTDARHAGVSDFRGRGKLVRSSVDPSAHAMFVAPAEDGAIQVLRIDDLELAAGTSVAIKIDVEGGELAVVEGARRTISAAGDVIIAFEAHPGVAMRTAQDPVEVMRAIHALRPEAEFHVDTLPARSLSPERPVFEQLPPVGNYNIVARAVRGRPSPTAS